jgi:bifunctional UDP-N-acetylglucosamine pyrophosphorylase/glucosamine-1-phosphate N-acetyltransferase
MPPSAAAPVNRPFAHPVAVVLAAGKSTRMKSSVPKVLHPVCGRPMIEYVLDAARNAGAERIVAIVGYAADQVRAALSRHSDIEFALQAEQKGTGHAVMMCREALQNHNGPVLILTGDAPLMRTESFQGLLQDYHDAGAACVIGTARTENNFGLGRIVRDSDGTFQKIVEEKDASADEKLITEINVGCYVFDCQELLASLSELQPNNKQGEYYLTDCCGILKKQGKTVIASRRLDISEALGVNTRQQLAEVTQHMQRVTLSALMADGVTIVAPEQTYIDPRASIGADTVIHPFTTILGPAKIGKECSIGPHAVVQGTAVIGDGTVIEPFQNISAR